MLVRSSFMFVFNIYAISIYFLLLILKSCYFVLNFCQYLVYCTFLAVLIMFTLFSYQTVSNLHRGFRRRCLDFEMAGARRKSLDNVSNFSSSMFSQSDEKITTNDTQLVPMKPGGESSRCILPGIGLHLNSLATTSKDYKTIKRENMPYGRQLSLPNPTTDIHSPTAGQGPGHESFSSASSERDVDGTENGVQPVQDASQEAAFLANEEFNQNSPKKKRHVLLNRRSPFNYDGMLIFIFLCNPLDIFIFICHLILFIGFAGAGLNKLEKLSLLANVVTVKNQSV